MWSIFEVKKKCTPRLSVDWAWHSIDLSPNHRNEMRMENKKERNQLRYGKMHKCTWQ